MTKNLFDFSSIFSPRIANALLNENITSWDKLISTKPSDLLKVPNFGRNSLNEIQHFLSKYDMSMGVPYMNDDILFHLHADISVDFSMRENDVFQFISDNDDTSLDDLYDHMTDQLDISKERVRQLVKQCYRKIERTYKATGKDLALLNEEKQRYTKNVWEFIKTHANSLK